jgi:hypothetical protein
MNNIKDINDINIRQTSIFSIRAMIHSDLPGVSPIYAAPILPQIPLHSHCIERFIRAIMYRHERILGNADETSRRKFMAGSGGGFGLRHRSEWEKSTAGRFSGRTKRRTRRSRVLLSSAICSIHLCLFYAFQL